jgi:spore maturation protein CgeB
MFRTEVGSFNPDVIWIFKGMEIKPAALNWAKSKGIKLVSYNPDNPFIFTGKGSGNRNVIDSIGLYDFHFSYNLEIQKSLEGRYGAATAYLPFGFEIEGDLYEECVRQAEIQKVCFLGNPDIKRAAFIDDLAALGVKIDVFGNKWGAFVSHDNISVFEPVHGDDLWRTLRRYRVQLNLMRIHNEDSHNMRSFEVPGIGGIMLAPDTTEHRMFFEDKKEVFLFDSLLNCSEIIEHILGLSEYEALQIRENARLRSVSSGYSYKDRAAFVIDTLRHRYG